MTSKFAKWIELIKEALNPNSFVPMFWINESMTAIKILVLGS